VELADEQKGLLEEYVEHFQALVGDKRTGRVLQGTIEGIIGAESLVCARIAAYSPMLATKSNNGEQRIRRMASGDTTKRSEMDAEHLIERLQARGVEQLLGDEEVWAIVDPSELRKPHAKEMQDLMRVRSLDGNGMVWGYRTLNVLGAGRGGKRGILYHRLFSSKEENFLSESQEIGQALDSVGQALVEHKGSVTYLFDSQFDDEAVWARVWEQGNHLLCRLKHQDRLVEQLVGKDDQGQELWQRVNIAGARGQVGELARVSTDMMVRKRSQRVAKVQEVTAVIASCPIWVQYRAGRRTKDEGPLQRKAVWLVVIKLERVDWEPWVLITDWPVVDEESAVRIFRMYRQRWAVEMSQLQCTYKSLDSHSWPAWFNPSLNVYPARAA